MKGLRVVLAAITMAMMFSAARGAQEIEARDPVTDANECWTIEMCEALAGR